MLALVGAVVIATLLVTIISYTLSILFPYKFIIPRTIPIIFLALVLIFISGSRTMLRLVAHYQGSNQIARNSRIQHVMIMGAGKAAPWS